MKISELNTDRALDVLCELTPYISNIASDEDMVAAVGKIVKPADDTNVYGAGLMLVERIGEIIPALFRNHRSDVYGILSVLNDKSTADIAAQPVLETIQQVRAAFQDGDLLSFFRSFTRQAQTAPSAPSVSSPVSA